MSDETPRLKLAQLVSLQELNTVTWNEALAQLDVLVDLCLLDQYSNTPPANPADGDAYLIGGAPTGAWSGYAYKIASCLDGGWRFYLPCNGLRAFVAATNTIIVYCNGLWTAIGSSDFATKSGTETLTNKTLTGDTILPAGVITASGFIGLGLTAPLSPLHVSGSTAAAALRNDMYADSAGVAPGFFARRARGTATTPTAVQADDPLGGFYFAGYTAAGAFSGNSAALRMCAAEAYTATASGSYITLNTTPLGGTTRLERLRIDPAGHLLPGADNVQNMGSPSLRLATLYAGSGTINTSGVASKCGQRGLSAAELAVAKRLAATIRLFQFRDAVAAKGADAARWHVGMVYEEVVAAFAAAGLDPLRYGIVCRDPALKPVETSCRHSDDEADEDRPVLEPDCDASGAQKWTYGLRYDELAQFVVAGLNARLEALEAAVSP